MPPEPEEMWKDWIDKYIDIDSPVPLFDTDSDKTVRYRRVGNDDRRVLKRHPKMEDFLIDEAKKVIQDFDKGNDDYEGIIYMMYRLEGEKVVPLYIGHSKKHGKDGNLGSNLDDVRSDIDEKREGGRWNFARWGDSASYHIGDLSAVVFNHEEHPSVEYNEAERKPKFVKWAKSIFETYSASEIIEANRILSAPVYFWTRAWEYNDIGIYGTETPLGALEYQLIGLADTLYPESLLNEEGTSR